MITLSSGTILSNRAKVRLSAGKMSLRAIKYENGALEILDQLLLPAQSKYIQVTGVEDGWKVINKMQVRKTICIDH